MELQFVFSRMAERLCHVSTHYDFVSAGRTSGLVLCLPSLELWLLEEAGNPRSQGMAVCGQFPEHVYAKEEHGLRHR